MKEKVQELMAAAFKDYHNFKFELNDGTRIDGMFKGLDVSNKKGIVLFTMVVGKDEKEMVVNLSDVKRYL